ncbi:mannose-6-phosphate isomerase-like protein (cupin superfamily) [Actinoalloteichus hoggarensis]|uniref:Cupin domain protein n=1 Tax=Actinoalloteichus hoggarensis TaxID=1470176 RepID=A0A221W278_9PSEU|nr:cupin domain-containing protein [Actinoalloteichus hoggarensis]ASO19905.1 Cupin domain protein [Actinoalloteichus hoggarensis]MBB5919386.1 mannose-6-phosphate isomerase-like protein (cupin superfamily) [Actinoalloteichus hoggarensis]
MDSVVSLADKLTLIDEHWSPRIVATVNEQEVKLVKVLGEFVWHDHPDTDELFLVVRGTLHIDLPDGRRTLRAGEMYVVPRTVRHRPVADEECHILLIESAGTLNTGEHTDSALTSPATWL